MQKIVAKSSLVPPVNWLQRLTPLSLALISAAMLADFIFRGLAMAFVLGKNDFLEVYTGALLWRRGQNFYDWKLATDTAFQLSGSNMVEAIVYPPSALAAFVPFTFLPFAWANFVSLLLAFIGIGVSIHLLMRVGNFSLSQRSGLFLLVFVLAFDPIHQAFHLGNIALLVVPICLGAIDLAEHRHDFAAGILAALATLLKPQLGVWLLFFYFIQLRKRFIAGAALPAIPFLFALLRYPVPLAALVSGYRENFQYHFGAGHHLGFTEGSDPFHVNIMQVVLYQSWRNVRGANILAHSLFLCGLLIWVFAVVWKGRFTLPVPLAISSLVALSFISLYHSVSDVAILTLAACWAFKKEEERSWDWPRRTATVILLLMLLPGHSALMRFKPFLGVSVTDSWWWKLFVARYFVWLLCGLNILLLTALLKSARQSDKLVP